MPLIINIPKIRVFFTYYAEGNMRLGQDCEQDFRKQALKNQRELFKANGWETRHGDNEMQVASPIPHDFNKPIVFLDSMPASSNEADRPVAECLITQSEGLSIGVTFRDCMPVLVYDDPLSTVAAIHLSRENLKQNFLYEALKEIRNYSNSLLRAHLGPCLRYKSHELSADDLDDFIQARPDARGFFTKSDKMGKVYLNYEGLAKKDLEKHGVEVTDCGIDTLTSEIFASFRRDGSDAYMPSGLAGICMI